MHTISEAVSKIIFQSPFLEEALADGLINVSSLARRICPDVKQLLGKPVKEGAVIMAINRLEPTYYNKINLGIKDFVTNLGDFTVRSNLMDYTFRNSQGLRRKQSLLLKHLEEHMSSFFTFSLGIRETTIIVSASHESLMDELFKSEQLVSKKKNLSTITMQLPVENTEISGFYYFILKNLAWDGINILEVISTTNEFTVVVNDDAVHRAFSILFKLKIHQKA